MFCLFHLDIKAQEITMFAGIFDDKYYQDDKRIKKKELTALLEKDIVAFDHWEKAKTFNALAQIALASEIGFFIWEMADTNNQKNDTATVIGVSGSLAAVIVFSILSHSQKKNAILKYNQGLDNSNAFSIKPSKNGLGVVMQF